MELYRPFPPDDLEFPLDAERALFYPDADLTQWAIDTFISSDGPLCNPVHEHLALASLGFLWTNATYVKRGMEVHGTAQRGFPPGSLSGFEKAAWFAQRTQWFGAVPDFIITLFAPACAIMDDAGFCALVEHELGHCAHAKDEFGSLRYTEMGDPVWTMRGHDCEQFAFVIERYGVGVDPGAAMIVEAARRTPLLTASEIKIACGSCR